LKRKFLFISLIFAYLLFAENITIKNGWQLKGAKENINISTFKESCIDLAWKYDSKKNIWKAYFKEPQKYSNYTNYIEHIYKGDGFWIKSSSSCQIDPDNKILSQKETNPFFEYMWSINPNSTYIQNNQAVRGSDINISTAWNTTYGDGIKVAVIDDCFDVSLEDIKDNIYKTYNVKTTFSDVSGENCHGTKVAGIISATDNDKGIIGVAPKSKLILISINLENSSDTDFIKAFEYAKDQGAKVINCSWGSYQISETLSNELKAIKDAGITTVFATGNDDLDMDENGINDESEDSSVIGVGASSEYNDVTTYSNYGSNMDLLAPGGEDIGLYTINDNNTYRQERGTSFSAPIVSGVVALLYSYNPDLTFDKIYEALTKSADKIGDGKYIDGFNVYRAYGKVNMGKSLIYIQAK